MDMTQSLSNMFSVRISNHNPFSNFGVAKGGGPTMTFGDLGRSKKAKRKSSSEGSSGGSGDDSLGDCDSPGSSPGKIRGPKGRGSIFSKSWFTQRAKITLFIYKFTFI